MIFLYESDEICRVTDRYINELMGEGMESKGSELLIDISKQLITLSIAITAGLVSFCNYITNNGSEK